jgi:hypothetical protein
MLTDLQPGFLECRSRFGTLAPPALADLAGDHRAAFVGPSWFRALSRFSLSNGGLPNWYGKRFDGQGNGINLLGAKGALQAVMPMTARIEASRLDGKSVAAIHYAPESPFPWRHVIDELRVLDAGCLVGMTLFDAPFLRRMGLPFLLYRDRA